MHVLHVAILFFRVFVKPHEKMVELRNRSVGDSEKECHVVTGGGGYAGLRLGKCLFQKGHNVVLFDVRKPIDHVPEGIKFIQVNSTNLIT